jgi:hypothetical protein
MMQRVVYRSFGTAAKLPKVAVIGAAGGVSLIMFSFGWGQKRSDLSCCTQQDKLTTNWTDNGLWRYCQRRMIRSSSANGHP